jgi:vacuolar protein 8
MGVCGSSCCGGRQCILIIREGSTDYDASLGKARDGLYEPVLAESEREAVADLLQYLENV